MRSARLELLSLAERQHGLASTRQALDLLGRSTVDHLLDIGELERDRSGVLRVRGSAPTPLQDLMSAVLAAGRHAALAVTTALAHWGVRGFLTEPIHVVRRRDVDDHKVRGVMIHEVRFLPQDEIRTLEGVPVVSPSLALLQLAGTRASDWKLGSAIDAAWTDRLVSFKTLTAIDERMSRQGRRGLTRFREALAARGPAYVPPASNLERRFENILASAGREPMRRQVDVSGDKGWIGRVDFKDERLPVIVEVQSARFHTGLTAEESDQDRIASLQEAGNEVVEVTEDELWHRPDIVLARVDAARAAAKARLVA
jgi:very-short-patch-repair endonuclease